MSGFQIRRGSKTAMDAGTFSNAGEPLFDTTNNAFYISDGSGPKYIGSPRRTEFAYCRSDANSSVAQATEIQVQWSTSNTVVSSSSYYTVAADGITVVKAGKYLVQAAITSYATSTAKGLEIRISKDGTSETPIFYSYQDAAYRRGSSAAMLAIMDLSAGEEIGVRSRGVGGSTGNVWIEADDSALTLTLLEEG